MERAKGRTGRAIRGSSVAVLCALFVAGAAVAESRFSIGPTLGLHAPALEDLNEGEFRSPIAGIATIVNFEDDTQTQERIYIENPLPPIGLGTNGGLELQWIYDARWSIIVGGSTWEATTSAEVFGPFAIQGVRSDVINVRSATISYNEFYFGLRHNVAIRPDRYKIYYRATLNEIFDIDYKENLEFHYLTGPAEGVNKSVILQTQATGVLAIQTGFGVEYLLSDWFSLAFDATYLVGLRRATLQENGEAKKDFLFSDNLNLWLPQRIGPESGNLEYLAPEAANKDDYRPLRLNFDGWKLLLRFNVRF